VCDRVGSFWTSDSGSKPCLVRAVPAIAGPLHRDDEGSFSLEDSPFRRPSFPNDLPARRPAFDSPRFLVPSTTSRASPLERGVVPLPPRFRSQAFSTSQRFPSRLELVALFRATAIPGILLCELLPPEDRVPLSGSLAPLRLSTGVRKRTVRSLVTRRFTDSHHRVVAWIPVGLWSSFQPAEASFPVVLGSVRRTRFVPPASPASKPSSPRETVPAAPGSPSAPGRCSQVAPLRSLLLPRLGFSTRSGPGT
jgi:hypothetical protein